MDQARLDTSPIGQLVPIVGPYPATHELVEGTAYLPDPLPTRVDLSTQTWTVVNEATAALARLDGSARLIPRPGLLRRPAIRREAQSTSALEGTYAPFEDVLAAIGEGDVTAEVHEILNFERAAELAFAWPEDRPLTLGMLGDLQRTLVDGTPGELDDAGGLRNRIVIIGSPGSRLEEARFVPPPPGDQLRAGTEQLLAWINDPPRIPTVVQAGMAHYQFECLHPYSDGNGRIGRLLVIVHLMRGAVIREPLLVVSPWFEQRRSEYQEALFELSVTGSWEQWIAFFAEGVAASAVESQRKVERLVALQEEMRGEVQGAGKRGLAERVAADLVGGPFVTVPEIARRYDVSWQGAANAVRVLVDLGILQQADVRPGGRANLFFASRVVSVLR